MAVDTGARDTVGAVCRVAPESELPGFAVDGLTPRVVAFPGSAEQVSAVLRLAAERHWAVIPRGGGTQMGLGNIPRAVDIVLCTTAMDRVIEYEPADLVVTVQAGIGLADLQRTLAEHGQFLALDPPLPDGATVGGIIAANASGPLRLRHGTVRDLLIGIKVVGAQGHVTKAGGKVVKNVTGYDMCKLYTGSLGTLGVIIEASFKLAPLPRLESTVLAWFGNLTDAYRAARAIYKSALPISACELLSPAAAAALDRAGGHLLAVWIGGGEAAVERQQRDVLALCEGANRTQIVPSPGEPGEGTSAEQPSLWRAIEDFGHEQNAIAKLSIAPAQMGTLLGLLSPGASFASHVLGGVTYVCGAEAEAAARAARELGGYAVMEALPAGLKRQQDVWGPVGPDFRLMERIKREFDPDGILNPGRYLGGL